MENNIPTTHTHWMHFMSHSQKHYFFTLIMIAVLILAAEVRFYNLDGQSFWYDEGVAFGHSQRSLSELIPRLQNNVHVPAYFGTLALWEDVTGSSEFALRAYSVLWSVLSVAGVYALGKRLFSPIAGMTAALLVTLNSFSIFYAQETRMYAMLAAISVLSMWAFVRWSQIAIQPYAGENRESPLVMQQLWRWGFAFALLNIVGEYTHVSYALLMLTQGVMAVILLVNLAIRYSGGGFPFRVLSRAIIIYVTVNLLTIIAFSPWLLTALSQIAAQPNISDAIPLTDVIRTIQGWFGFGITFEEGTGGMTGVMYFLLIFGLMTLQVHWRKDDWWMLLLPVIWVLVSAGLYLYLELYSRYLRFLLPAQIGFALWIGRGVWILWGIVSRHPQRITRYMPKIAAVVAVFAFAWTQFQLLTPLYHDENYQRDDYRGMIATIEAEAYEGNAIILDAPGLQEIFFYYYAGELPVYPLPAGNNIAEDTSFIIEGHERIFVVFYGQDEQDPEGIVEHTLNTEAFQISSEWVGDVRFERYAAPVNFSALEATQVSGVRFGDSITLERVTISNTVFSANDVIQMQLQWSTSALLETRYKVFVQLLDSNGLLVAQRDSQPSANSAPTTLWQIGEVIEDNHALAIGDLAAGEYTLIIGLYDMDDASLRLPVGESNYLVLGQILVE